MSDNKGDGLEKKAFDRMVKWMEKSQTKFVIGLGDHVKKGWKNSFLDFLKVALNDYNGERIIRYFKIPSSRVVKTGKREEALLEEWLKSQGLPSVDKKKYKNLK